MEGITECDSHYTSLHCRHEEYVCSLFTASFLINAKSILKSNLKFDKVLIVGLGQLGLPAAKYGQLGKWI